ncbi:MAG: hypothetical protein EXR86_12220 [Gammaproteobacteria bacterium]|nr:hypothetical protein [Gammaproteobacteria bacterium]
MDLKATFAQLRIGIALDAIDHSTQTHYESWARLDTWRMRSEALPLAVGVMPEQWDDHLRQVNGRVAASQLEMALADYCGLPALDSEIVPGRIRQWMQSLGIDLPLSLARLLDFISVLLPAQAATTVLPESPVEDRCTILGAALSLITKVPEQCVDADGYFDCARIAHLIFAQAIYWFPLAPPGLSEAEAAALLRQWVAQ